MRARRRTSDDLSAFRRLIAGACVALVLALTALAASPALHAWLHGEKALDADDDCAVVLFANGVTPAGCAVAAVLVFLRLWRDRTVEAPVLILAEARFRRPLSCGPPPA